MSSESLGKTVADIMSRDARTVSQNTQVGQAAALLAEYGIRHDAEQRVA